MLGDVRRTLAIADTGWSHDTPSATEAFSNRTVTQRPCLGSRDVPRVQRVQPERMCPIPTPTHFCTTFLTRRKPFLP